MEKLLMDFANNSAFVNKFLDRIMYWLLDVIEEYNRYDELDAIHLGDDWGQQHGLIMGPSYWREYIKPRLKVVYAAAKSTGKYMTIHSCGDVKELFPDLIEIGLNMFNPFQPEVMDVYEMKRLYGDKLTFHGGISLQKTLVFGSPEDVRQDVLKMLEVVGKNGGYVCDACHAITRDVPAENIDMLIKTVQNQTPKPCA
jgi:uroporphyrinogen decarboxylase